MGKAEGDSEKSQPERSEEGKTTFKKPLEDSFTYPDSPSQSPGCNLYKNYLIFNYEKF